MKKINVIILVVLIISIIAGLIIYKVNEKNREYEVSKVENYNYFVLKKDDKYGVIGKQGNTIIEAKYENVIIPNPEKAVFICYKDEQSKVLNENKQEIFGEFGQIEPIRLKNIASDLMYEKTVLKYSQDNKFGLINTEGKKLTRCIYDEIDSMPYKEGELLVKLDEKYGVINIKGKTLIKPEYEKIEVDGYYTDEDGYKYAGYIASIKTEEGYRYGYINIKGKLILKTQYNEISRITNIRENENIYLITAKNGQYGLNKNTEEYVKNEYQSIRYDEENNIIIVEKNKKYGMATLEGEVLIPINYEQIDVTGIYLYAKNEQGTIVFDNKGKQVNIDVNESIVNTENENYRLKINSSENTISYSVVDKNGKEIIKPNYSYIEYLHDNYFIACNKEGKLGLIDSNENQVLEFKYDSIQKIQDTKVLQALLARTKTTEVYSSKLEKKCEIENIIIEYEKEYIKVYNEKEDKYFDHDGNELKNTQVFKENTLFAKQADSKWGFINEEGSIKVEFEYDRVTEFNKYGYAGIKKDNKWGIINENGQVILEPTYELKNQVEPSFIGEYYQVKYGFGEFYYTDAK